MNLPESFYRVMANRPVPLSEFDQVHMLADDCYCHALELLPVVAGKRLIFLGDSDCVALAILVAAMHTGYLQPERITVLDFDKRVLNYIARSAKWLGVNTQIDTGVYNVLHPFVWHGSKPPDFFHINPPFGSRNSGQSAAVWLYRAADMCGAPCSGCVILANNEDREWCGAAEAHVRAESQQLAFSMQKILKMRHSYNSPWDPELRSRGFIISRERKILSPLSGRTLPHKYIDTLYGEPVEIPEYIDYPRENTGI